MSPGWSSTSSSRSTPGSPGSETKEIPIVLAPRKGESKLRTFRDGWRSLRMMLLYSPNKLFLVPGATLLLLGCCIHLAVLLGLVRFGGRPAAGVTAVFATIFSVVGFEILSLGLHAKTYSWSRRFDRDNRALAAFYQRFKLESGLLWSAPRMALVGRRDPGRDRGRVDALRSPAAAPSGVGLVRRHARDHRLQHAVLVAVHLGDVDEPGAGHSGDLASLRRWTATDRRCLAALLALAAWLWLPRLRGPLDLRYDAGVYYTLGTSLAEGRGYRLLNEPGAIRRSSIRRSAGDRRGAPEAPAGTQRPRERSVSGSGVRSCCCRSGYVAAVFALAPPVAHAARCVLAALITALHVADPVPLRPVHVRDPVRLTRRCSFCSWSSGDRPVDRAIAARSCPVAAGVLALARTACERPGLALLAAWAGESLLPTAVECAGHRARRVALVAVGSWQAYTRRKCERRRTRIRPTPTSGRITSFTTWDTRTTPPTSIRSGPSSGARGRPRCSRRLAANVGHVPAAIGEAVSMPKGWWWGEIEKVNEHLPGIRLPRGLASVAVVGFSLVVLAGMVLLARAGHVLPVFYVAASVALIVVTPWPGQFSRYLVPLTPVLALALVQAHAAAGDRARGRHLAVVAAPRGALTAMIALAVAQQVVTTGILFTTHHQAARYVDGAGTTRSYALFYYEEAWRAHDDALAWLATHGRADDIVASSAPPLVYLRTGHASVMPPYEASAEAAERLLESVPVTYLVLDNLDSPDVSRRYLGPVVDAYPDRWRLVYDRGGPRIYRSASKVESLAGSK